jgi:hypothetical protein
VGTSQPRSTLGVTTTLTQLLVSFHFTIRAGCAVEVVRNDDASVVVYVEMNSAGYTPPPLPKRTAKNYSLDELNSQLGLSFGEDALGGLAGVLNLVIDPKGLLVLARGVETDEYDATPDMNFSSANPTGAVIDATVGSFSASAGITVDNSQPYPVSGWIEVKWGSVPLQIDPNGPTTTATIKTLFDLNGKWTSGGAAGPVISVSGNAITVDMSAYKRPTAHGTVMDAADITVTFPDDKTYTAKLQSPNKIVWSNNSSWTKS